MELVKIIWEGKEVAAALAEPAAAAAAATVQKEEKKKTKQKNPTYVHLTYTETTPLHTCTPMLHRKEPAAKRKKYKKSTEEKEEKKKTKQKNPTYVHVTYT